MEKLGAVIYRIIIGVIFMKKKWISAVVVIAVAMICMFIFKDIKYRLIITCIGAILVSHITRKIK